MTQLFGNIHSIESCGTVDGPGIRLVVFLQGCPMRCLYCHNPDSWDFNVNKKMSSEEILAKYDSVKEFLKNGGITATGGEPLAQIDFVIDLFRKAKNKKIHTVLDTSGVTFNKNDVRKMDELMKYTDLVMLDIKHIDNEKCKSLVGVGNKLELAFARYLNDNNIPVWIRQVLVPGYTDDTDDLLKLRDFIKSLSNVQKVEILPYHSMGKYKWEKLCLKYELDGVRDANNDDVQRAKKVLGIT